MWEMTDEKGGPPLTTSEQRRPERSALTGKERKISSCINDEVGREKRKKEVTAG